MALVAALRPSADPGNGLAIGSDGGLWGPQVSAPRGGPAGGAIDNSWAAPGSGTFYYALPGGATGAVFSDTYGTAYAGRLMVTRDAQLAAINAWVTTSIAAATLYNALYNADAATGLPTTKVADWFTFSMNGTGLKSGTILNTPTLAGYTPYWLLSWFAGASTYPAVAGRSGSQGYQPIRLPAGYGFPPVPSQLLAYMYQSTTVFTASTTTGPANVSPYFPASSALLITGQLPAYWWGLRNV